MNRWVRLGGCVRVCRVGGVITFASSRSMSHGAVEILCRSTRRCPPRFTAFSTKDVATCGVSFIPFTRAFIFVAHVVEHFLCQLRFDDSCPTHASAPFCLTDLFGLLVPQVRNKALQYVQGQEGG